MPRPRAPVLQKDTELCGSHSLESQLTPPKFLPASIYSMQFISETVEHWKGVLKIIYFSYVSFSFLRMLNCLVLPEAFLELSLPSVA